MIFRWNMPLNIHRTIPVQIHWTSDSSLDITLKYDIPSGTAIEHHWKRCFLRCRFLACNLLPLEETMPCGVQESERDNWGQHSWGHCKFPVIFDRGFLDTKLSTYIICAYLFPPSVKVHYLCSDPISVDPMCP